LWRAKTVKKALLIGTISFIHSKASLSGDFISLFSTHSDFGNSAEEFHPYSHETLIISLFSNMVPHQHN
jgi:hypothetical protein